MLTLAEHILDSKAGAFEPASFRDRYEEALLAHLKARQAGVVHEPRPVLAAPHRQRHAKLPRPLSNGNG
jgi:DNA end-binding protein Ku